MSLRALFDLPGNVSVLREIVDAHAGSILSHLRDIQHRMSSLERPEPAFVCMLIEGRYEKRLVTAGASLVLHTPGKLATLEQRTYFPMRNVRVVVFCDLARVRIQGIFCGADLVTAELGECPVGRFDEWLPGIWLRVPCELRA